MTLRNYKRILATKYAVLLCASMTLLQQQLYAKENGGKNNIEVIKVLNSHDFTSSNYQVIRRSDFIDSSNSLSDILGQVNGIQIRQISGIGNPVSISIRGSSAKQVQFYIDGQLVNDSQFGSFDLNQLSTAQIESIEISKNQAIGSGSTPIGGVIRINTYNPSEDNQKISASLGSFGYKELSLLKNTAFKYHSIAIGGTYLKSNNDYDYTLPNPEKLITEQVNNNDYEKLSFFINDNAQIDQHQLRLNLTYNKQDKALPQYQFNPEENSSNISMNSFRYGFQYNWLSDINYLETIELEYYNDQKDEFYFDNLVGSIITTNDYQTDKQQLGIKPSFNFNNISFNPYINLSKQKFSSYGERNGEPTKCNGISACDIQAEQYRMNLGARLTWQSISFPLHSYLLINQLNEDNSNIALNQLNADTKKSSEQYNTQEIALNYGKKEFTASINWSNGLRTPTLYELFGDRGSFKGNDNLLPEQAETYSLSIKYHKKTPTGSIALSSSVYQQFLEDSIVAIFNSSGTGSYTNVSNAELLGFELQANSEINTNLSLSLQAHIIDSNTQSKFLAFNNKSLPGIYHQQYGVSLAYKLNNSWRIELNSKLDKDLYFNRSNQFEVNQQQGKSGNPANRAITDLSLQWHVNNYHINLTCLNLFDENYQDLANRPAQGRSFQLKFSIEDI